MWYSNPAWWAIGISIIALLFSGLTFLYRRSHYKGEEIKRKSEIQRNLTNQAREINEGFVRWGVKGPYAHHLGIAEDNVKEFSSKAVMLLHQLNMLRDVFQNRAVLGEEEIQIYAKWASTILRPWIEADEDLKKVWFLSKEAEDLRHPEFSDWINGLLPLLKK